MSLDPRGEYLSYHREVRACIACSARQDAKEPVPGVGTVPNDIMILGRNPGEQEDRIGLPFIGPAGQMVDKWLERAGLSRNDVFITNSVLCHTSNNRIPLKIEISTCTKLYLLVTLKFVKPKLVIPMGALAAEAMGIPGSITNESGKVFNHKAGFAVIPVVHPGGVLRKPELRTMLDYAQEVVAAYVRKHRLGPFG